MFIAGPSCPGRVLEVPNPVIVVEVLLPSTRHIDASAKLAGYFSLASVHHYLIIDPEPHRLIHHARGEEDTITTRLLSEGVLRLDPPGIAVDIDEVFASSR